MASLSEVYDKYVEELGKQAEVAITADPAAEDTSANTAKVDEVKEAETAEVEVDDETKEAMAKFAEAEAAGRIAARAFVETLTKIASETNEEVVSEEVVDTKEASDASTSDSKIREALKSYIKNQEA